MLGNDIMPKILQHQIQYVQTTFNSGKSDERSEYPQNFGLRTEDQEIHRKLDKNKNMTNKNTDKNRQTKHR